MWKGYSWQLHSVQLLCVGYSSALWVVVTLIAHSKNSGYDKYRTSLCMFNRLMRCDAWHIYNVFLSCAMVLWVNVAIPVVRSVGTTPPLFLSMPMRTRAYQREPSVNLSSESGRDATLHEGSRCLRHTCFRALSPRGAIYVFPTTVSYVSHICPFVLLFLWLEATPPLHHGAAHQVPLQWRFPIGCLHSATNGDALSQNTVSFTEPAWPPT